MDKITDKIAEMWEYGAWMQLTLLYLGLIAFLSVVTYLYMRFGGPEGL